MPVSPIITFDVDDTLIASTENNEANCRAVATLWRLLEKTPVSLHIVSGRAEMYQQLTKDELADIGIVVDDEHLHLRPADCLTDQEHKLRCATALRPLLMIDNSVVCAATLLRAGYCYLKAPGAESSGAHA